MGVNNYVKAVCVTIGMCRIEGVLKPGQRAVDLSGLHQGVAGNIAYAREVLHKVYPFDDRSDKSAAEAKAAARKALQEFEELPGVRVLTKHIALYRKPANGYICCLRGLPKVNE